MGTQVQEGHRVNDFIRVKGWLWPAKDIHARKALLDRGTDKDIDVALKHMGPQRRSVLQAGGHCGVWARKLAGVFRNVYTFEPDPINFACLVANTRAHAGVHRYQAALGARGGHIALKRDNKANTGAFHVDPEGLDFDATPLMTIDSLSLTELDLLILDIEGYEELALRGGQTTIESNQPVIMIEEKGLDAKHFASEAGAASRFLNTLGYVQVERVARDSIFVHEDRLGSP
jgi:FkbM family methyltransferase